MTREHTSYDEIDTPTVMREDAAAAGRTLRLDGLDGLDRSERLGRSGRLGRRDPVAEAAAAGAPSLEYADHPREVVKREIAVDEAAARIANALHLHLD
jgi:hypothetical protein